MQKIVDKFSMLFGLILLIITQATEGAGNEISDIVIVDRQNHYNSDIINYLSEKAKPQIFDIIKNENIKQAIERQCGEQPSEYYEQLISNFSKLNKEINITNNNEILLSNIEANTFYGPYCLPSINSRTSNSERIKSPYRAYTVTIEKEAVDDLIRFITKKSKTAKIISEGDETDRGALVSFIEDEYKCPNNNNKKTELKPFDFGRILSIFITNTYIKNKYGITSHKISPTVYIPDTGLYPDSVLFEKGTLYELNLQPDDAFKYADHGTRVTSLVLGGFEFSIFNNLITNEGWIYTENTNIFKKNKINDTFQYYVDSSALKNIADKANDNSAILNLSVRFPNETFTLQFNEYLKNSNMLIIAAAGNSGENLSEHTSYPAKYGGDINKPIIIVAALDSNKNLTNFSNRSADYVEIGSLGCNVPTMSYNVETGETIEKLSQGTSFAAPQVTAVAAWLKSEDRNFNSITLKHHILSSSDLKYDIRNYITHGRVLNPYKALISIYSDIIETQNGDIYFGEIIDPNGRIRWNINDSLNVDRENLKKISAYGDDYIIYYYKDKDDYDLKYKITSDFLIQTNKIKIRNALTNTIIELDKINITDIIFAKNPYWRFEGSIEKQLKDANKKIEQLEKEMGKQPEC